MLSLVITSREREKERERLNAFLHGSGNESVREVVGEEGQRQTDRAIVD